ncbi:enoyl-CoA hydratase-related protein [Solimonas sp. K1W22B-7]|uniref:enoyl-CoA hydratase-related protein n=1 Tax=Solimonas sp. K1W22B-7 TaxID=2303331 RepID=UPI0013C419CF|nr:enoyl-CoA hydratase-related protein [Solimonas sp. K1W22B-7]
MNKLDSLPVIIGIGEITDRPERGSSGLEPLRLIEQAARRADEDAGGGWLARVDRLDLVPQVTWPYPDLPALAATTLGITAKLMNHTEVSGDSPVRLLMDAAVAIAEGRSKTVLICGAEAMQSLRTAAMQKKFPEGWTAVPTLPSMPKGADHVTPLAARYGLTDPTEVYTLYENATQAAWGQSSAVAQQASAALWERYALAASHNPCAWDRTAHSAQQIAAVSPKNRPISYPYTKRMVAQLFVNQGAAVLMTSHAQALAAGIPEQRLVYVWSGAGAVDLEDFLARDRFDHSPPMEAALRHTLSANGLTAQDLDAVELYSCFPCIPKLALRTLGPLREGVEPTVTGGLPFFGGPVANYMTHAIAAMVRELRVGRGTTGLLYGNGGYVTKHHAAILATRPPQGAPRDLDLQAEVDAARGPSPAIAEHYEGPAVLESFVLKHDAGGDPALATIVARTPEGQRTLALIPSTDSRGQLALVNGLREPVGLAGTIRLVEGQQHWSFDDLSQIPIGGPGSPVLLEKLDGHIAVVTLNRPARHNAVNPRLAQAMAEAVRATEDDPDIRAVVLASSNAEVFCAGMDLSAITPAAMKEMGAIEGGFAGFTQSKRRKPWIAAVRGQALGGGFELVLACDMVVASERSAFGLPEVKRGLLAAANGVARLPRVMPRNLANAAILTGEPIPATVAHEHGIVNRLVADEQVLDSAMDLARRVAANAPLAVVESLAVLRASADESDEELSRRSIEAGMRLFVTRDVSEGARAFLEKRTPNWQGR